MWYCTRCCSCHGYTDDIVMHFFNGKMCIKLICVGIYRIYFFPLFCLIIPDLSLRKVIQALN